MVYMRSVPACWSMGRRIHSRRLEAGLGSMVNEAILGYRRQILSACLSVCLPVSLSSSPCPGIDKIQGPEEPDITCEHSESCASSVLMPSPLLQHQAEGPCCADSSYICNLITYALLTYLVHGGRVGIITWNSEIKLSSSGSVTSTFTT